MSWQLCAKDCAVSHVAYTMALSVSCLLHHEVSSRPCKFLYAIMFSIGPKLPQCHKVNIKQCSQSNESTIITVVRTIIVHTNVAQGCRSLSRVIYLSLTYTVYEYFFLAFFFFYLFILLFFFLFQCNEMHSHLLSTLPHRSNKVQFLYEWQSTLEKFTLRSAGRTLCVTHAIVCEVFSILRNYSMSDWKYAKLWDDASVMLYASKSWVEKDDAVTMYYVCRYQYRLTDIRIIHFNSNDTR